MKQTFKCNSCNGVNNHRGYCIENLLTGNITEYPKGLEPVTDNSIMQYPHPSNPFQKQTTFKIGDKVRLIREGTIFTIEDNASCPDLIGELYWCNDQTLFSIHEIELMPTFPYMPGDKVEYTGEIEIDLITKGEIFVVGEEDSLNRHKPRVYCWNYRFGDAVLRMSEIQPYPLLEV